MHILFDKRLRFSVLDRLIETRLGLDQSGIVAKRHCFAAGLFCRIPHQNLQWARALRGNRLATLVYRREITGAIILLSHSKPNGIRSGFLSEAEMKLWRDLRNRQARSSKHQQSSG